MSRKQSDRCVFCNWTRKNSWPSIKFFNIPKEPGLKKVRWLQSFGDRKISHRDRVCSVHFRSGRPTNDPSHEDFVPHLYLNTEPPAEIMRYLEQSGDKESDNAKILAAEASVDSFTQSRKNEHEVKLLSSLPKKNQSSRPAILQRKRKANPTNKDDINNIDENRKSITPIEPKVELIDKSDYQLSSPGSSKTTITTFGKNVRIVPINRCLIDAAGIQVGQNVIIKRKVKLIQKQQKYNENDKNSRKITNINIIEKQEPPTTPPLTDTRTGNNVNMYSSNDNYSSTIQENEDDMINPPMLHHMGMQVDLGLTDDERLIDTQMFHTRSENNYIIHQQQQIYQDVYADEDDMYNIYRDYESVDSVVLTSAQR